MPRKKRIEIGSDYASLLKNLQFLNNEVFNVSASINKQIAALQLKTISESNPDIDYKINQLLQMQCSLLDKRLDIIKEQRIVIENNAAIPDEDKIDPNEFREQFKVVDQAPKRYYVYFHRNNKTGDVFYVGKGSGYRAYVGNGRPAAWRKYVVSIGHDYSVEIYKDDLDEFAALALEEELILDYAQKYKLVNFIPKHKASAIGIPYASTGLYAPKAA